MKKTFLNFLSGCMLLLSATAAQAQGLQGIIVEEFHTVTQADADFVNNDLGNSAYTLNPGSKVYRIFVDMAPGYRLVSIFASPAATFGGTDSPNPLTIQTTTNFWNDDNFGSELPAQTRRVDEGTFFDSFISVGTTGTAGGAAGCGSSLAQLGVPRALDPDGDLTTCGVYPGFSGADGSYPGTAPSLTTNLGGNINFAALTEDASTFTFIDDVWATLPSIQGFDPNGENIIFVGQFTTDGDFSFQINVAVGDPDNNLEEYVHSSPGFGQFQRDFLTFPQVGTPDCLGVIGGAALPGTPCDDGLATTGNDVYDADCNCVGQLIDCLGVAGGSALPGTPCDDGNVSTGNDIYGADCTCAGQLIDCLGVIGGPAVAGTPCDDGDATTGNDVYGADCTCAGQLIDCLGVAGGTALPGTPCDDGLATTGNDVYGADCTCAGQLIDCLGVAGGTALPGTPCDDGLATTGNDVYGADCTCAGQLIDCLGVAGGSALPGTPCDDGNPNSSNDVYGSDCNCSGTLANDCLGVAGGTAQPGTPCDDGDATTGNDVYGADCTCAGQLIDCLGVAGGSALPGTPCDDGLATTGNDVYGADCTCAGQLIDCLGVAGGSALPGTPCDDGNPNSSNDVYGADCTCAGTLANDCLGVAGGTAQPGTPCDDGDATTGNDVYGADCTCAGQLIDCLGVAGGSALPGTPCDDGQATTGNDVYGADCTCAGQLIDCLGVAGGSTLPGTPCDDGNPNSSNDVYGADCTCAGTLANDCLGVAGGSALPGTPCNDGDATTVGDTWTADCQCVGTPIGGGCTLNELFLEIQTDGTSETTWEFVTSGTAVVVASGGSQYAGPGTVIESVCLADGCYDLRVFDDAGDGITGGGYILRNSAGDRIIDNRNNFTTGTLSAVGNGPSAFCLPIGTQNLVWLSRDKLDWVVGEYLVAEPDAAVSAVWIEGGANNVQSTTTGYQFWIFDPNGSFSYRRFRSHATSDNFGPASATRATRMKINYWLAPLASFVPENVMMNVRVRSRVNGVNGNWGPASRFKIDPVRAQCPLTQLADTPGDAFLSCGQTREFGPGNFVWARPVTGANRYQFRFRLESEGFEYVVTRNTYVLQLNWNNPALEAGKTYDVDVRVSKDFGATWCTEGPLWGESCTISIVGESAIAGRSKELSTMATEFSLWPNPNNGDQLWLNISEVEQGVELVAVEIIDLNGKRVADRMIPVSGANTTTRLELEGQLGSGVYIVRMVAGNSVHTERLVIAR